MRARTSRFPCSERRTAVRGAECQGFWSLRRLQQVAGSDSGQVLVLDAVGFCCVGRSFSVQAIGK
ncbi:MAG: hypothetical protein M3N42_08185 [Cyanobacteriota bacterium]|nr:hypothetical protein [Cyanobacteriota bacterium]